MPKYNSQSFFQNIEATPLKIILIKFKIHQVALVFQFLVNNSYFCTFSASFLPTKMSSLPVEDGEILEYLEELSEISSDDEEFEKLREQKKNLEFENYWMSGMY